jgi:hypothetical protein
LIAVFAATPLAYVRPRRRPGGAAMGDVMRRFALAGPSGLVVAAIVAALAFSAASAQSDAQVKQQIIRQSLAAYPGPCPCPYSVMRNGRSCGGRSAYSRPGGYAPICYPADVSQAEVAAWRNAHR